MEEPETQKYLLRITSLTLISYSTPAEVTVNGKLPRQSCPWAARTDLQSTDLPTM